eukprot:COSAG02_NODE_54629_length_295_cov_0.658163_1_plen_33_part_10
MLLCGGIRAEKLHFRDANVSVHEVDLHDNATYE